MRGKVCLITGATNGIGLETARELARMGATVIMVGRNPDKTVQAVNELKEDTGSTTIDYLLADLSLMSEVRKLADEFKAKYDRLDVLLNNAGAMYTSKHITAEGLETTFALNHISYFLLTHLLLDLLKASTPSRIINVSSDAHQAITKLDFDNLQAEKGFNVLTQYSLSKFENILFTYELARRLEGTGVTANALHPGLVRTGFGRNDNPIIKLFMMGLQLFAKNAKQGAETSIYLASSPDVATINGKYFVDYKERRSNDASYNREYQKRLWEISEQITGVHEIS